MAFIMKITFDLDSYMYQFDELSDKQRLELVKRLIFSAPNAHEFWEKFKKAGKELEEDLD